MWVRRAPRVDRNHKAIVEALREEGCSIHSLAGVANGCPDLLCGVNQRTFLLELKDGEKPPSAQSLTPDQVRFINQWKGFPIVILRDVKTARMWAKRMQDAV
jgi:Holliday junction resolvase